MGWPSSATLLISSKLPSKMNTASNWTITVFQHTQGKLGRESWIMMKACTIMTFLMTVIDGCALKHFAGLLINLEMCLWLIMPTIWQLIGDRLPQWLWGQLTAQDVVLSCEITFCRMYSSLFFETVQARLRASQTKL